MATVLHRTVRCGRDLSSVVIRSKHTLIHGEGRLSVEGVGAQKQKMHQDVSLPSTCSLPPPSVYMPPNVKELEASEKAKFCHRRARDTSSARIAALGEIYNSGMMRMEGVRESSYNFESTPKDCHMGVYDCSSTVSLDSSIQTNVPKPYGLSEQAPSHFSSPDCHSEQDDKYVAGDLRDHHHVSLFNSSKKNSGTAWGPFDGSSVKRSMLGVSLKPVGARFSYRHFGTLFGDRLVVSDMGPMLHCSNLVHCWSNSCVWSNGYVSVSGLMGQKRCFHNGMAFRSQNKETGEGGEQETPKAQLTSRQKLQRTVKEYGSTVIVFHIAISLASLGICYLLVSSGVDMTSLIKALGINLGTAGESVNSVEVNQVAANPLESAQEGDVGQSTEDPDINTKRVAGAATFVVAYAVHKVFAPVRIAISCTATPFIVHYLRRIGFIKPPKPKSS